MVEQGEVLLNGEPEYRKRAKLRSGDLVEVFGEQIKISSSG
jgi:ribosome-associated protein